MSNEPIIKVHRAWKLLQGLNRSRVRESNNCLNFGGQWYSSPWGDVTAQEVSGRQSELALGQFHNQPVLIEVVRRAVASVTGAPQQWHWPPVCHPGT